MRFPIAAAFLLLTGACSQQQGTGAEVVPQASVTEGSAGKTAAQTAYQAANEQMHEGMAAIDPDPDVAFMQGMLAHHRGAVAMSEVALDHGRDAEVRALAASVIAAQQREIAQMEAWLAKRGKPVPAGSAAAKATASGAPDVHAGH